MPGTLVWLSHDLRLADNPALHRAHERGEPVIPVFIWHPEEEGDWPPGGAHRWWLHESLNSLDEDLRRLDSRLIMRVSPSLNSLKDLLTVVGADAVYWNRRYTPALQARDKLIEEALRADGIEVRTFSARMLHDPEAVRTGAGTSYKVFTPFWKKLQATLDVSNPLPPPSRLVAPPEWPSSASLDQLALTPLKQDGVDWANQMRTYWSPGEKGGHDRLDAFLDEALRNYSTDRNRPDKVGSSQLSPYLHHGELSPRQVWHRVESRVSNGDLRAAADVFLSEIAWREFAYHALHHFPALPEKPLREKFNAFPWSDNEEALRRWQRGQTGYPIVDAGMRQLWALGWMHNRVRMIAGSFLTKDLLIRWQDGERWFWDTLVDGDLANNAMNWQWVAGCGPDAQPFFRIFNPISQGEKHDPDGTYVRRWVPELVDIPTKYIHKPWEAPVELLDKAGIILGQTYPDRIVDHSDARKRALAALAEIG